MQGTEDPSHRSGTPARAGPPRPIFHHRRLPIKRPMYTFNGNERGGRREVPTCALSGGLSAVDGAREALRR